ncbi:MAG TPA: glycosyltransferase family 2 protein [Pyrinomonadaceae bacterium]|jgi:glycosyltransferase involved in cell wall biosynthesis|nr:glycosyltransferase family 2 protein [Pyrinomonadaceae bacterium]
MKITAAIISFNEEENIRAACESVAWADEILVVDSESTDETQRIAAECGARVVSRTWPGFALQKQFATDQAAHDWVLSLDADERVSPELGAILESLRDSHNLADGYRIPRRSFYMGRWIKGGGWYPDLQLRFFRRTAARWQGAYIHESVKMNDGAQVQTLSGDLLHYPVRDASYHHRMIGERYAPLAARQMFEAGRRTSPFKIVTAGPAAFVRSLILKNGFSDGLAGWSIASFAAHHAFLKNLLLWEMQDKSATDEHGRNANC